MKKIALIAAGLSLVFFVVMTIMMALNNFKLIFIILTGVGFVLSCTMTIWFLYAPESPNARITSRGRSEVEPQINQKQDIQKRLNLLKELWESKAIDDAEYEKKRNDILSDI